MSEPGRLAIERYSSAAHFLAEAGPWLAAKEPENNLVFGLAQLLATGDHPFEEPVLLAAVKQDGRVAGCAVRPPPDHLDVTALPPGGAALLAEQAAEYCPGLTSVGGPPAAAREFARTWVERNGGYWRMVHHWSWFVLRAVRAPRAAPGMLRVADETDWPLIEEWAPLFVRDTSAQGNVLPFLERRLRTHSLYVWDNDGPKCMASVSGHTPNGLRISGVYTPVAHRARGYASNAVAGVSQLALDSGRSHCVLFAETQHTATLRVYQNIGYELMHETVVIEFTR